MKQFLCGLVLFSLSCPVSAQKGAGGGWAERMIVVVALKGKGTFEDPRRPDLPLELLNEQSGIAWRYELADDGRHAVVYLTSARPGRLADLPAKAKVAGLGFEAIDHSKLDKAGVDVELKRWKKDLTLERLVGVAAPTGAALAAGGGK